MAEAQQTEEGVQETVPGYSGSPHEGQGPSEPPEGVEVVHENAVVSNVGVTEPTQVFKGDGTTPADAEVEPMSEPKNVPHPQTEEASKEAPEGSVISPAGVTPPTLVYQGDGVTLVGEEKSNGNGTEDSKAKDVNYEDFTVAELKDQAESRGIDVKHDWNKGDIIKALKKADKAEGR